MNLEEAHKLLTVFRAAYPSMYKNTNFDDSTFGMERRLWANAFAEFTFEEVYTAFNIWLSTEPFPPVVVELKKIIIRMNHPEKFISADRAWEQVGNAVRKYGWPNQEKAMESFAPNIRRAIQHVGGWQKLCSADEKEWNFRRKDFLEVYDEFEKESENEKLIPISILKRLEEEARDREELIDMKMKELEGQ